MSYMHSCFGRVEFGYAYHNPEGFWQGGSCARECCLCRLIGWRPAADKHARGKRLAWPGFELKGELKKMNLS